MTKVYGGKLLSLFRKLCWLPKYRPFLRFFTALKMGTSIWRCQASNGRKERGTFSVSSPSERRCAKRAFFLIKLFWANKGEEVGGEGNSPLFEVPNKLKLSEDFHFWFVFLGFLVDRKYVETLQVLLILFFQKVILKV